MAGIVHFTNFYRWMEVCEHEFLRSSGSRWIPIPSKGALAGLGLRPLPLQATFAFRGRSNPHPHRQGTAGPLNRLRF